MSPNDPIPMREAAPERHYLSTSSSFATVRWLTLAVPLKNRDREETDALVLLTSYYILVTDRCLNAN